MVPLLILGDILPQSLIDIVEETVEDEDDEENDENDEFDNDDNWLSDDTDSESDSD
jgi:hypothetical protein